MATKLFKRLEQVIEALPLEKGIRVLEIGCGPGAMAREISKRIENGNILAIDRSDKAIQKAIASSQEEIESGKLSFRKAAIEKFVINSNEKLFDIAVAIRVGALDGRQPLIEKQSLHNVAEVLTKNGKLFFEGNPLKEIPLHKFRNNSNH